MALHMTVTPTSNCVSAEPSGDGDARLACKTYKVVAVLLYAALFQALLTLLWHLLMTCYTCCLSSAANRSFALRYRPSMARFCVTVPAGLSQSSMVTTREAALDADIIPTLRSPALLLATEPEAAALIGEVTTQVESAMAL
jgi:hypothetical protein